MSVHQDQLLVCQQYVDAKRVDIAALRAQLREAAARVAAVPCPRHKGFAYLQSWILSCECGFDGLEGGLQLLLLSMDPAVVGGDEWSKVTYRAKKALQVSDKHMIAANKLLAPSRSYVQLDTSAMAPAERDIYMIVGTHIHKVASRHNELVDEVVAQTAADITKRGLPLAAHQR